ncbi:unnamed protein product, partial [Merluccius merluccius]
YQLTPVPLAPRRIRAQHCRVRHNMAAGWCHDLPEITCSAPLSSEEADAEGEDDGIMRSLKSLFHLSIGSQREGLAAREGGGEGEGLLC